MKVRRKRVLETAGEGKLGRQSIARRKHSSLELPSVPLHLIAMLIDAAEEVCAAVHIQHYAGALLARLFAIVVIGAHLDPLCFQRLVIASPLPPCFASHTVDTLVSELRDQCIGSFGAHFFWNSNLLRSNPARRRNPLCGECLYFFDRVMRGVEQKCANEM